MDLIYQNPLRGQRDINDFVLEGKARISFDHDAMMMENELDSELGQKANYVLWCPAEFPSDLEVRWEFLPLTDQGLCILFMAAGGQGGRDLFDSSLSPRTGEYRQYHSGDINAYHVSYFRRKEPDERTFHTCNLRKSYGFHLVAQGGDPIPEAAECREFYQMCLRKKDRQITFLINGLELFHFLDDGSTYGDLLGSGKIGFRQLAPLKAKYKNLEVYQL